MTAPIDTVNVPRAVFEAYKSLASMAHWQVIDDALQARRVLPQGLAPGELHQLLKVSADVAEILAFMRRNGG